MTDADCRAGAGQISIPGSVALIAAPRDVVSSAESARVAALHDQFVLDTPAEDRFDRIAELAAAYFRTPVALVSLVDNDRQWFKSCIGLPVRETPREWAFCDHSIRLGRDAVMVVEDASNDIRFFNNPLVVGAPHIRFYAGAVLTTTDGNNLGTLCIIDTERRPSPSDVDLQFLRTLAKMVVDQLELSKARGLLDEQHRLLKNAEAMSGVGHWRFDLITQHVTWSDEVFRIHGMPPGVNVPQYEEIQGLYHEDDRATLTRLVDRAVETGEGYEFQLRIRRPDGSVRHTIAKAECVLDQAGKTTSIVGVFQDVTRQHLAAASLAESERHCRLLAENVCDVIAVYGADGIFRYVSPSITSLLGYAPEELVGRTPFSFIHLEDRERVAEEFRAAAASSAQATVEYRALTKGGATKWLEAKPKFHRDALGELVEISDSVRDVTERHFREAALQRARLEAENAGAAKAVFLANMSHEIRTPMNAVFGFAELLARTDLTDDQRQYLKLIADSGRAMMRLLNDILDMSKIDSGRMHLAAEAVHVGHKLYNCVQLMEPIARSKGVELTISLDPTLPERIVCDPLRIRQILLNLIGNAVKFTDTGGIAVNARNGGDQLLIEIEDSGVGIPADRLDMIFQQFSQADASVARRFGGTGLGLSISTELARLMGGSIDVISAVGVGTTFTLRLPLVEASKATNESRPDGNAHVPRLHRAYGAAPRVLIAEDHEINQVLITALAKAAGFVPTIATNGAEAIAKVLAAAATDEPFDLVLMDMQMPVVDGLSATRQLRALGVSARQLPIIALTANAFAEDRAACLAAGMQAHLAKPVRLRDLEELATRLMDSRDTDRDPPMEASVAQAGHEIADLYDRRRTETLEAVSASMRRDELDSVAIEALITGLHNLAGTAGFFGNAPLGDVASELEHALKRGAASDWRRILRNGWERLQHAA
ncbi:PAS domain-containing protein [Sphingomonas sp. AR_OL41]|uniref:PAS domain-containing protein n=1 Tax=Sphingomonas sp. AR_OL41 TaxID=3042729 RepID=UPI002480FD0A|nr:PAS domain-containing protein [Sphingomonas sp. AR_OL41]MDH7973281.1 PAS domain-containing protein [Sphingomonas sp. AR_OL41]